MRVEQRSATDGVIAEVHFAPSPSASNNCNDSMRHKANSGQSGSENAHGNKMYGKLLATFMPSYGNMYTARARRSILTFFW